jgi:DNA primase
MAIQIPNDKIEEINQNADIVEVIGDFLDLKRRGRNFITRCPFHEEKTPSFNVSPERNIFKCFGCGKSGDSISFLMEYNKLSFVEAAVYLANKFGIDLRVEESPDKKEDGEGNARAAAYKVIEAAAELFHQYLFSKDGVNTINYFQGRGFKLDTFEEFNLGLSPDSWDATSKHLLKKGFSEDSMRHAGLIIDKDTGGYYDRFRGRAMFPIRDFMGRVIGFGARDMTGEQKTAKYINSPQSIIYDKSQVLYGLFEAKNALRNSREAILVEGYADVITLHQAGFKNAVASSGTALTEQQVKLLSRYTKKVNLLYDSDDAGQAASEKALPLLLKEGLEVTVIRLPDKEDPDSLIRDSGVEAFKIYKREAVGFIDFLHKRYEKKGILQSPSLLAEALREVTKLIRLIPDKLQQHYHIRRMVSVFKISENELEILLKENKSESITYKKVMPIATEEDNPSQLVSNPDVKEIVIGDAVYIANKDILKDIYNAELLILKLALTEATSMSLLEKKYNFSDESMISEKGKRLFSIIRYFSEVSSNPLSTILQSEFIEQEDKDLISALSIKFQEVNDKWDLDAAGVKFSPERNFIDAIYNLAIKKINIRKKELELRLSQTEDADEQSDILKELRDLNRATEDIFDKMRD